jgi:hypothetical protein
MFSSISTYDLQIFFLREDYLRTNIVAGFLDPLPGSLD